jgi:hypothetical protein
MEQIVTAFFTALSNCSEADRLKIAIKNQKRDALIEALHQWAFYVLLMAKGDVAIALSSGYNIGKAPSPSPPLVKPEAPVIESGINPGELISKGKPVAGGITTFTSMALRPWLQMTIGKVSRAAEAPMYLLTLHQVQNTFAV